MDVFIDWGEIIFSIFAAGTMVLLLNFLHDPVTFKSMPYQDLSQSKILLSELPEICIRNAQPVIYCNDEPLQGDEYIAGILPVHRSRLVPDHFLPEQRCEFFNFSPPEFLRQYQSRDMIPRTMPGLLRRQGKVHSDQRDAGDKPMAERVFHGKMMEMGSQKGTDGRTWFRTSGLWSARRSPGQQ
jgi:hypothetical protein